jgi:hypothetical protein
MSCAELYCTVCACVVRWGITKRKERPYNGVAKTVVGLLDQSLGHHVGGWVILFGLREISVWCWTYG